jgi:hypothetical protein
MLTLSRLFGAGAAALAVSLLCCQRLPAQEKGGVSEKGIVVQARGPIHEAFAEPHDKDPTPSVILPKKPPDPIPEEPPDQRPKGDNVQWIPGYWAWDSEKKDYLWVSGFWRVAPPDRRWVPGHWSSGDEGWQWVPGFWGPNAPDNLQYLPEPPDSLENGPSAPVPQDDSFYVPGTWRYRNSEYVWQPGYWTQAYPGWVWNQACYRWTPSGYVFVNGYWDYPLANRGLLYAPVYFQQPLWLTPGWAYRPQFAVSIGDGFLGALFIRPGYGHYYFGDYYDPFYVGLGFYPWYSYGGLYFDPLFRYYRWANRFNRGWHDGLHNTFVARRDGLEPRPARTFVGETSALQAANGGKTVSGSLVVPMSQLKSTTLTSVSAAQLTQQRTAAQQIQSTSSQRTRLETSANFPGVGRVRESFYSEPGGGLRLGSATRSGPSAVWSAGPSRTLASPSFRGTATYSSGGRSFSGGGFSGGRSGGSSGGHGGGSGGHR